MIYHEVMINIMIGEEDTLSQLNEALIERRKEHSLLLTRLHDSYIELQHISQRVAKQRKRLRSFPLQRGAAPFLQLLNQFDLYIRQHTHNQTPFPPLSAPPLHHIQQFELMLQTIEQQNTIIRKEIDEMKKTQTQVDQHIEEYRQYIQIKTEYQDQELPPQTIKSIENTINTVLPMLIEERNIAKERIIYLQHVLSQIQNQQAILIEEKKETLQRRKSVERLETQVKALEEVEQKLIQKRNLQLNKKHQREEHIESIVEEKLEHIVPSLMENKNRYEALIAKALQFMKGKSILEGFQHLNFMFDRE